MVLQILLGYLLSYFILISLKPQLFLKLHRYVFSDVDHSTFIGQLPDWTEENIKTELDHYFLLIIGTIYYIPSIPTFLIMYYLLKINNDT